MSDLYVMLPYDNLYSLFKRYLTDALYLASAETVIIQEQKLFPTEVTFYSIFLNICNMD